MHFNYFLPGRTRVSLEALLELGLGYVFEPETAATAKTVFTPRPVTNGPGGQHGLIVSLSDEYCGYYKDRQIWKQELDCDYWVGMWRDKPPTPDTLARENLIAGAYLRLDDGHDWLLPAARHWEEFEDEIIYSRTIPARLTRDESGDWCAGEPKRRYRELWRLATELMAAIADREPFSQWDNVVIECFKCNYKISAIEIDMLGIHDDHVRNRVPRILLDLDNFDTLVKKKLTSLATGLSSVGPVESAPEEDTAATGLPAAT